MYRNLVGFSALIIDYSALFNSPNSLCVTTFGCSTNNHIIYEEFKYKTFSPSLIPRVTSATALAGSVYLSRKVDIFVVLISKGNFLPLSMKYEVCCSILGEGVDNLIKIKDVISIPPFLRVLNHEYWILLKIFSVFVKKIILFFCF